MSPPLVLLHAFGAAGRSWDALTAALGPQTRALAPDLPGFGDEAPLTRPSVDAYADWVEALVMHLDLRAAVLGGWSMGGKIALALAARRPVWLSGLVLISPSPPEPEPMDEADRQAQLAGYRDLDLARRTVEALMHTPPPSRLALAIDDRLGADCSAWRWWLERGSRESLNIAPPTTPTLLVVGDADQNLGLSAQRRYTAPHLIDPKWIVLPNCGHFAPLEDPEALSGELLPWLENISRSDLDANFGVRES